MKTRWIAGLVVVFAGLGRIEADFPQRYTFTDLGAWGTRAMDITDSGKVLIQSSSHSFIWDNGDVIDLGTYQGIPFEGEAMNEAGQVAGEVRVGDGFYHPAIWENGVVTDLGTLGGDGGTSTTEGGMALAINSPGEMVGWSRTVSGDAHAFLWTPGGTDGIPSNPQMKDLGPTKARGINDDGEVAGYTREDTDTVGFLWHNDVRTEFSSLGNGAVQGNNENGDVVGTTHDGSTHHAFVYSGGMVRLLSPTKWQSSTWGLDVNDAGIAVGQIRVGSSEFYAGVSVDDTMRDLNELIPSGSGFLLKRAHAINNAGQIVGYRRIEGSGSTRAFLLTPIPALPPEAHAGGPYTIFSGKSVTLDSEQSTDPNYDIVSYRWDLDGDEAFETDAGDQDTYEATPAHLASLIGGGHHTISVLVTDDQGLSDTHETLLTILVCGDGNIDGFIDDDDLGVLLANWTGAGGSGGTWGTGDFDDNGSVSHDDLSLLLSNWTGPPPAGAVVPEPVTFSLLALGGVAVMRRRRR